MPGFKVSTRFCDSSYFRTSSGRCGRGHTRLMSQMSTLKSCGSSSISKRRMNFQTLVILGSFSILKRGQSVRSFFFKSWALRRSASGRIDRNLNIEKWRSNLPTRTLRYTGAWKSETQTANAVTIRTGDSIKMIASEAAISKARFNTRPHGPSPMLTTSTRGTQETKETLVFLDSERRKRSA